MYVMTFRMTFLSVTHHVHVLGENRSSIQSLALMRLAITSLKQIILFMTIVTFLAPTGVSSFLKPRCASP